MIFCRVIDVSVRLMLGYLMTVPFFSAWRDLIKGMEYLWVLFIGLE